MTNDPPDIDATLFGQAPDFQGSDHGRALLDQYKLYVDTMEKAVARRQGINGFYLTANSILITAMGVMVKQSLENIGTLVIVLPLAIAGILICVNWRSILENHRQLNAAKFEVIHRLERQLPAALFKTEWSTLGEGKYKPISRIEKGVAFALIILYGTAIAISFFALLVYALWACVLRLCAGL